MRERREDIPGLIEHFLPRFSHGLGRNIQTIAPEAMRCLLAYDWPGNVRQLQSVLKYAIVQAAGDVITLDCLPENLRAGPVPASKRVLPPDVSLAGLVEFTADLLRAGEVDIYRRICQEMDRVVLASVMRHVQGNQVKASELLGISRTTLRAKLRTFRHGRSDLNGCSSVRGSE